MLPIYHNKYDAFASKIIGVTLKMMDMSGKYLYTIRSANGVLVENLQIFGKSRSEADAKIRQMYWRCEILSCSLVADSSARAPNLKMQWLRPNAA